MADGLDALRNDGVRFRNWDGTDRRDEPATIIVVGVPRSGTSMVAGCLRELGVPLGSQDRAVFEDVAIAHALESGDRAALADLIAQRNAAYRVWGFKRPAAFQLISDYLDLFRNPRLVVTFRDPLAIAVRNNLSVHVPLARGLRRAARALLSLTTFVAKVDVPVMLVSYEKAMQDPDRFVADLDAFCGTSAPEEVLRRASGTMENGPALYLTSSRVDAGGHEGRVDRIEGGVASGWARRKGRTDPVVVVFKQGERVLARVTASGFRQDLKTAGKGDGNCAFEVDLGDPTLTADDVTAVVEDTSFELPR